MEWDVTIYFFIYFFLCQIMLISLSLEVVMHGEIAGVKSGVVYESVAYSENAY